MQSARSKYGSPVRKMAPARRGPSFPRMNTRLMPKVSQSTPAGMEQSPPRMKKTARNPAENKGVRIRPASTYTGRRDWSGEDTKLARNEMTRRDMMRRLRRTERGSGFSPTLFSEFDRTGSEGVKLLDRLNKGRHIKRFLSG